MNKFLILVLGVSLSVNAFAQQKKATGTPAPKQTQQPALPKATGAPVKSTPAAQGAQQSAGSGAANGGAEPSTTVTGNTASARPIPETDLMYKKVVWRGLDLREKQNKPMFSVNKEITKVIIDAAKRGELVPYKNDSLTTPLSGNDFSVKLTKPDEAGDAMSEEEKKIFGNAPAEEDDVFNKLNNKGKKGATAAAAPAVSLNEFFPKELYQLEMRENIVFDKKRSRMYYDIQAITLVIPVKYSAKGVEERIASFRYSDLVKVFRAHPNEAIWYNEQNDAQHKNLADAFDLRLFSSYIKKVSNANDDDLATINEGSQKGLLASQKAVEELIEWESSLWSY